MTNAATLTPAQIDAEIARLSGIESQARRSESQYRNYAATTRQSYMVAQYAASANLHAAKADAARTESRPYRAEFTARGGWNRYFLVTNTGGHIHRGMNCGTCFSTTEYAWLVALADCDEAAMVAEYGEMACTVCFPNAPTFKGFADGTSAQARRTAAEKAQIAAEKAEKAEKAAAKALLAPVRIAHDTVRTVASAQSALRRIAQSAVYYPNSATTGTADRDALVAALEAKGFSTSDIVALETKATTKATKELAVAQARFAATGQYV